MKELLSDALCAEAGCDKARKSREWCHNHYMRRWEAGTLPPRLCTCGQPLPAARSKWCDACQPPCCEEGCDRPARARSYCPRHYDALLRRGGFGDTPCLVPECARFRVYRNGLCSTHYQRAQRYGMTIEELLAVVAGAPCDICGDAAEYVDHCHVSGQKRGFLCPACNSGLGFFRDDPARLAAAIDYLASPPLEVRA